MTLFDELLAANGAHGDARAAAPALERRPRQRLAVVTCMDARIDVLAALGLELGDTHILRNAGGRVTDDVLRSLALSVHILGTEAVVLLQHTDCGLAGAVDAELRAATGADVDFLPIADHASALRGDVQRLAATPYLSPVGAIAGWLYDVDSGRITEHVRWRRTS